MTLNKFGHSSSKTSKEVNSVHLRPLLPILNTRGYYDFQNNRAANIKAPLNLNDATTKQYVDEAIQTTIAQYDSRTNEIISDMINRSLQNYTGPLSIIDVEALIRKTLNPYAEDAIVQKQKIKEIGELVGKIEKDFKTFEKDIRRNYYEVSSYQGENSTD